MIVVAALAAVLGAPAGAGAEERSLGENYGLGLISGLGSVVYFPFKMVYATIGGLVGGLTFLVTLGDEATANAVWQPTLGGSYVLTPDMIAGQDSVQFVGEPTSTKSRKPAAGQWPE